MFHVGAVFLTVGLFLLLAAVITNETNQAEIAELIGTGVVCLVIGLFLVILNRFYGQREEEELQHYVETRLARTRSGQRLYHEADSYPENLDAAAHSRTPSMDSGLSNDVPQGKGKKDKDKNKKKGISGPSSSAHGSHHHPPTTTVNVINEHNHSFHSKSPNPGGSHEISAGGVTLDRLGEETENLRRQNSHGDDPAGLGRSGNLYRVYNATTA